MNDITEIEEIISFIISDSNDDVDIDKKYLYYRNEHGNSILHTMVKLKKFDKIINILKKYGDSKLVNMVNNYNETL